ncbi:MAG TPA: hypothetical protein VGM90_15855 [Kofleriaceae bacterium]|jgi:hypothetical protein
MAMSPTYALAHVFLPNLVKLKGAATVQGVIDRKEKFFFDQVWAQAHVTHLPTLYSEIRGDYKIGVIDLPPPKDMGEAFFVAVVAKQGDPQFGKFYLLEHDYVLATKSDRTLVTEREGTKHSKHFDGPVLTNDKTADAKAFVEAFMELLVPTRVSKPIERKWT